MTQLVHTHSEVTRYLKEFLHNQYQQLDEAKLLLSDYELVTETSTKSASNFIGNPVNSFVLIKKLTKDLQRFVDTVNSLDKLKDVVREIKEAFILPTNEDYEGAIIALHRLEDTYSLEPSQIRRGNLSALYPSKPLSAFECYEFGRVAYEHQDYYHTIRWMNEALAQLEIEKADLELKAKPTASEIDILDYLSFANGQQGNLETAMELTKRILKLGILIVFVKLSNLFELLSKVLWFGTFEK